MRQSSSALWALQAGVCWLAAFAGQTTASPVAIAPSEPAVELQPRSGNNQLRIMPLGASITAGFKSSDENGYRKTLFDRLEKEGWKVDMVGSLHDGNMTDNAHEGHVGYRVDQFDDPLVDSIIKKKPNLILINLGTNDATQKHQVKSTGDRMDALLTRLYEIPDTTIILSTLIRNTNNAGNVEKINDQYRKLVDDRRDKHDSIVLAEMSDLKINLQDGTHPDNDGYEAMAEPWADAIKKADLEGLIKKPVSTSTSSSSARDNKASTEAESSSPPSQSTSVKTSGAVSQFPHKRFWTWVYTFV